MVIVQPCHTDRVVARLHPGRRFFCKSRTVFLLSSALNFIYHKFLASTYLPRLVEEIDASGAEVSLEGESRVMSVMFSDVRGFTTISEGLNARELTQMMNEFLTPFTRVIQDHRGTIDPF